MSVEFFYDDVIRALKQGSANVKFIKVNGDFRDMTCTLDESVIGSQEVDPNGKTKVNRQVVRCFDTNADGWRSFRLDSVLEFSSKTFSWTK